jgi:hypothetical protein
MGPYLTMQNYQDIGKNSVRACDYPQPPAESTKTILKNSFSYAIIKKDHPMQPSVDEFQAADWWNATEK